MSKLNVLESEKDVRLIPFGGVILKIRASGPAFPLVSELRDLK